MSIRLTTFFTVTMLLHGAFTETVSGQQSLPDTLVRYANTTAASDSISLVAAADDALQGRSSVTVPMVVKRFVREKSAVLIELSPEPHPRVIWHNLAGTVRIMNDGRRVILSRR